MANGDRVLTDQHLLHEEPDDALPFGGVQCFGARAQSRQKAGQGLGEPEIGLPVLGTIDGGLQLAMQSPFLTTELGHSDVQFVDCDPHAVAKWEQRRRGVGFVKESSQPTGGGEGSSVEPDPKQGEEFMVLERAGTQAAESRKRTGFRERGVRLGAGAGDWVARGRNGGRVVHRFDSPGQARSSRIG